MKDMLRHWLFPDLDQKVKRLSEGYHSEAKRLTELHQREINRLSSGIEIVKQSLGRLDGEDLRQLEQICVAKKMTEEILALSPASREVHMQRVELHGVTYPLERIDQRELEIFKVQFRYFLVPSTTSDEGRIMLEHWSGYLVGMRAIKHALAGRMFRGFDAAEVEIGVGTIRPNFVQTDGVYRTTWVQELTPEKKEWIGPFTLSDEYGMVVTHIKSFSDKPSLAELEVRECGGLRLPPFDTRTLGTVRRTCKDGTRDVVSAIPIPTIFLLPGDSFCLMARSDSPAADDIALGGLMFGLGMVLRQ